MKKVNPKNSYWITFYFTFTLEKMTKDKKKRRRYYSVHSGQILVRMHQFVSIYSKELTKY